MKTLLVLLLLLLPPAAFAQDKESAAVGQALAKALNERAVDAFMQRVDAERVTDIILKDLGLSAKDAEALRRQLPQSVRNNVDLGMRAIEQSKGSARFLRSGTQEGRRYAIVRIDMGDGGVDYARYFLSARGVEDWYTYATATLFSSAVRFNLATMLKSDSLLFGLLGMRSVTANDIKPFTELRKHLTAGDFPAAYRTLEEFPEAYRKSRQWALMRVTYGGRTGDEQYRAALRHLAASFGGDADLQLILVDHYFFEKQFDRALAGIASLERSVGGEDGSSSSLRGNVLTTMKRYPDAEAACRRAIALERDFRQAYWCLVTVGLESGNAKLTVDGLSAYEKAFDEQIDATALAKQEAYKSFARTPEFARWAKSKKR